MEQPTPSIEAMLEQLEQLVQQLETGSMPFERALTSYKQGLGLADQCKRYLKQSKEEVKALHDQYMNDDEA